MDTQVVIEEFSECVSAAQMFNGIQMCTVFLKRRTHNRFRLLPFICTDFVLCLGGHVSLRPK